MRSTIEGRWIEMLGTLIASPPKGADYYLADLAQELPLPARLAGRRTGAVGWLRPCRPEEDPLACRGHLDPAQSPSRSLGRSPSDLRAPLASRIEPPSRRI